MNALKWWPGSAFDVHSYSECGYYLVKFDRADPRNTRYQAIHVPMLWAPHASIGRADTPEGAQRLCTAHRDELLAAFEANRRTA